MADGRISTEAPLQACSQSSCPAATEKVVNGGLACRATKKVTKARLAELAAATWGKHTKKHVSEAQLSEKVLQVSRKPYSLHEVAAKPPGLSHFCHQVRNHHIEDAVHLMLCITNYVKRELL